MIEEKTNPTTRKESKTLIRMQNTLNKQNTALTKIKNILSNTDDKNIAQATTILSIISKYTDD